MNLIKFLVVMLLLRVKGFSFWVGSKAGKPGNSGSIGTVGASVLLSSPVAGLLIVPAKTLSVNNLKFYLHSS